MDEKPSDTLNENTTIQHSGATTVKSFFQTAAILAIVALTAVGPSALIACTGITIKPRDGSIIFDVAAW